MLFQSGIGLLVSPASFAVRYWGTRGSVPVPGPDTVRYGGNTSCVEILANGQRLILDAGTGILGLGKALCGSAHSKDCEAGEATLLLTHFHWDHIQGLPFFSPAYNSAFKLHIVAPKQDQGTVESMIRRIMGPVYFPLPWDALEAKMTFAELEPEAWTAGEFSIGSARMRHYDVTVGYRIEAMGVSVVFIPDNELVGGPFPAAEDWRENIVEFVGGADLLIHDGMFTAEEYLRRSGWGHSTVGQCLDLAIEAGVKTLHVFHHSPDRTDDDLDRILDGMRESALARSSDLEVAGATEGQVHHLAR